MKRIFCVAVLVCFVLTASFAFAFTPGTYEGNGKGYSATEDVKVKVTVDADKITAVEIEGAGEVPFGVPQFENYSKALIGRTDGKIDAVSGATMTRNGISAAVEKALEKAKGTKTENNQPVSFKAGEYTATADGYIGPVTVKVVFDDKKITAIDVIKNNETGHVGDVAFGIMIPEMIQANGSGVDAVSGATLNFLISQ